MKKVEKHIKRVKEARKQRGMTNKKIADPIKSAAKSKRTSKNSTAKKINKIARSE